MSNILKRFIRPNAEPYAFPDTAELQFEQPEEDPAQEDGSLEKPAEERKPSGPDPRTPIDFAKLEAEMILRDARAQAEEILEQARLDARQEVQQIMEEARAQGERDGYADGMARAVQEGKEQREAQAARLAAEVRQFLDRAAGSVDDLMDRSVGDLRDLSLAVAEKVVRVSLKSSGEVIGRMIQAAIDKRKRREWVHIYIADCDAHLMTQLPPSLSAALAAISGRVRIIPMADDESGTCIVEMPDEIIDASASTQLSNIRSILMDAPSGSREADFRRRASDL